MTDYNDGKWHGWNGGECPVNPDVLVEIMLWSGSSDMDVAGKIDWSHNFIPGCIIAFRVIDRSACE